MKVFISWSGDASRKIALKLFEWLPMVLQSVQPYMSAESIDKGTRWASSISGELEGTSVGIVVLTPDNLTAPWIYFESGALAKVVGDARLAPLLCGLKPSDVGTPLSQFQVTVFNKDDVLRLLKSINTCAGEDALPDSRLEKMHGALWGDLFHEIDPIISAVSNKLPDSPKRAENEVSKILEEILVLTRQQAQTILSPEKLISKEMLKSIVEISSTYTQSSPDIRKIRSLSKYLYTRWSDLKEILFDKSLSMDEGLKIKRIKDLSDRMDMVVFDIADFGERGRARLGSRLSWNENRVTDNILPTIRIDPKKEPGSD